MQEPQSTKLIELIAEAAKIEADISECGSNIPCIEKKIAIRRQQIIANMAKKRDVVYPTLG